MIQEHWNKGVAVTCPEHHILHAPTSGCPLCILNKAKALQNKERNDTAVPDLGADSTIGSFKLDAGKPRIGLVLREVPHAIEKLGTVLGFGAEKYSIGNWKNLEDIEGRFLDSMMRHLTAYHKGEKVDPESGESHLAHAFFNLAILLEQEQRQ